MGKSKFPPYYNINKIVISRFPLNRSRVTWASKLSSLKTKEADKAFYNILLQLSVLLFAAADKEKQLFTELTSSHQNCSQTAAGTPLQLPFSDKNE